jgi:hypothetical protein
MIFAGSPGLRFDLDAVAAAFQAVVHGGPDENARTAADSQGVLELLESAIEHCGVCVRELPIDPKLATQLGLRDRGRSEDMERTSREVPPVPTAEAGTDTHATAAAGNATSTGSLKAALSWLGDETKDVFGGLLDGVEDFGAGVVGSIKDGARGFWEATGGTEQDLLHGRIGEGLSSQLRGLDRMIFQPQEALFTGLLNGAQDALDGLARALGPIGTPISWLADRTIDAMHTALDTALGLGSDAFREQLETAIGFVSDLESTVKLAAGGQWGAAARQFGMAFLDAASRPTGVLVGMGARVLQAVASIGQTMLGLEPPGRPLSEDEIKYLKQIYGNSIDYGLIRIKPGGALNDLMADHTVGNTVYMVSSDFNTDGTLTNAGLKTLSHEVGHVWENQNGGIDYLGNALFANLWYGLTTTNPVSPRNNAYHWRRALANGVPFAQMNAEQKAQAMEAVGQALRHGPGHKITMSDLGGLTKQQVTFLRQVAREIRRGEGAG